MTWVVTGNSLTSYKLALRQLASWAGYCRREVGVLVRLLQLVGWSLVFIFMVWPLSICIFNLLASLPIPAPFVLIFFSIC